MNVKKIFKWIASAICGAAVFFLFFVVFESHILITLLCSLAALLGVFLSLSKKKIDPELKKLALHYGLTPRNIKKTIKQGRKKVSSIKREAKKIEKQSVQKKIMSICDTLDKIFKDFEKDPKDIKAAREFLNYYLDATKKIIKQYSILSKQKTDSKKRETLKKAEDLMSTIEEAFENQLTTLYNDDYLDLNAEISVLDKAIEMQGLKSKK